MGDTCPTWGRGAAGAGLGATRTGRGERRLSPLVNYSVCNIWDSENEKLKRAKRVCTKECGERGRKAVTSCNNPIPGHRARGGAWVLRWGRGVVSGRCRPQTGVLRFPPFPSAFPRQPLLPQPQRRP